eukprot:1361353-Prymnesium_polylepis.1
MQAALQSFVLLRNDGTLPLAPGGRKLAVVGPQADPMCPGLAWLRLDCSTGWIYPERRGRVDQSPGGGLIHRPVRR